MTKIIKIGLTLAVALLSFACSRFTEEEIKTSSVPDGTPVTLQIGFGTSASIKVDVGTKAEASAADESRVHDLYVMIFKKDNSKVYGRYFSYEHLSDLTELDAMPNEGWWVENKTLDNLTTPITSTKGVVKVSTESCKGATIVVLANVDNAICIFDDSKDNIAYLNGIEDLDQLKGTVVKLQQDVVNRKDLFLMMGSKTLGAEVSTADMEWGTLSPRTYNEDYKIELTPLDAKVKFLVKCNIDNSSENHFISEAKAVYWEVYNAPDRCFLFPDENGGISPANTMYFSTESAYFEGTETIAGEDYYVFTFYMLENRKAAKGSASSYHERERQNKIDTGIAGYEYWYPDKSTTYSTNYVDNEEGWINADDNATYVKFDLILTLTEKGIQAMGAGDVGNALTSDTIYTVHLGDFTNNGWNDYNILGGHYYKFFITLKNSGSIYAEVENNLENQPGQEGFLLLTNDEIVNADCHYEYRSITFTYNPSVSPDIFSWYVKTPFCPGGGGGPTKKTHTAGGKTFPEFTARDDEGNPLLDYLWVKFAVNGDDGVSYSKDRVAYPGDGEYDSSWGPWSHYEDPTNYPNVNSHPNLMDINQLIEFIFDQTQKETDNPGTSLFKTDLDDSSKKTIRVTVFIDEYYYEEHPLYPGSGADPNLWRDFVNAKPREMHILSDAKQSRDRNSDVILSSHSIIQQSIQTIYNTNEPTLRSIWGCEHLDEIKEKWPAGWPYWPADCPDTERAGANSTLGKENGRLNSAYIWGVYSSQAAGGSDVDNKEWNDYLNYTVDNNTPELRDDTGHKYRGMAWSCLTRNRDNNGNGIIDRNEVRWYLAASSQLAGIWVGNESLSLSARLYQPNTSTGYEQWRAHVVSSTDKRAAWSEEGAGATEIKYDFPPSGGPTTDYHTWSSEAEAAAGQSVRCVRNVGTYDDSGTVKDISEAPYDKDVDTYFTLEKNGSGDSEYYVFHFSRLNNKSIREYSAGELPYHDQNSMNNRVYVKMITSKKSDLVSFDSVPYGQINLDVSAEGYNKFCPEGYRFPNQTEWLLMELYVPSSFQGGGVHPTRTYYDRGLYGNLRQETAGSPLDWSFEKDKVGWTYSNKLHCVKANVNVTKARCVKDEDMTGNISGVLSVEGNRFLPSGNCPINFNFSSTASALSLASLELYYPIPHNGNSRTKTITVEKQPKGMQYLNTINYTIPSLSELGLDSSDLPLEMTLTATLHNNGGKEASFTTTFRLSSHYYGTVEVVDDFDPVNGFPIRIAAESSSSSFPIKYAKLRWKKEGDSDYTEQNVTVDNQTLSSNTLTAYWHPDWLDRTSDVVSDNSETRKYYFSAVVGGDVDEGLLGRDEALHDAEMEFFKINYNPNPEDPNNPWAWNNQPTVKWYAQTIGNLNFSLGDFVDAYIDVTQCEFRPKNPQALTDPSKLDKNNDVGMDNLISFGPTTNGNENGQPLVEWNNNNVLIYYPAHNGTNDNLQIAVIKEKSGNPASISRVQPFDLPLHKLKVLLKRDNNKGLLLVNNYNPDSDYEPDWINEEINSYTSAQLNTIAENTQGRLNNLTDKQTIYVASTEGKHRSRALYKYVRVVRKHN